MVVVLLPVVRVVGREDCGLSSRRRPQGSWESAVLDDCRCADSVQQGGCSLCCRVSAAGGCIRKPAQVSSACGAVCWCGPNSAASMRGCATLLPQRVSVSGGGLCFCGRGLLARGLPGLSSRHQPALSKPPGQQSPSPAGGYRLSLRVSAATGGVSKPAQIGPRLGTVAVGLGFDTQAAPYSPRGRMGAGEVGLGFDTRFATHPRPDGCGGGRP